MNHKITFGDGDTAVVEISLQKLNVLLIAAEYTIDLMKGKEQNTKPSTKDLVQLGRARPELLQVHMEAYQDFMALYMHASYDEKE